MQKCLALVYIFSLGLAVDVVAMQSKQGRAMQSKQWRQDALQSKQAKQESQDALPIVSSSSSSSSSPFSGLCVEIKDPRVFRGPLSKRDLQMELPYIQRGDLIALKPMPSGFVEHNNKQISDLKSYLCEVSRGFFEEEKELVGIQQRTDWLDFGSDCCLQHLGVIYKIFLKKIVDFLQKFQENFFILDFNEDMQKTIEQKSSVFISFMEAFPEMVKFYLDGLKEFCKHESNIVSFFKTTGVLMPVEKFGSDPYFVHLTGRHLNLKMLANVLRSAREILALSRLSVPALEVLREKYWMNF